jgi:hypothetical protein
VKDSIAWPRCSTLKFILYAKPDKESFFKNRLRDVLHRSPDAKNVGVVVTSLSS